MLDDNVTVRVGKQDVNSEFFFIDLATDFIQSTFGLSPSTAFPTYPDPSMAAVVLLQLHERMAAESRCLGRLFLRRQLGFLGQRLRARDRRAGIHVRLG